MWEKLNKKRNGWNNKTSCNSSRRARARAFTDIHFPSFSHVIYETLRILAWMMMMVLHNRSNKQIKPSNVKIYRKSNARTKKIPFRVWCAHETIKMGSLNVTNRYILFNGMSFNYRLQFMNKSFRYELNAGGGLGWVVIWCQGTNFTIEKFIARHRMGQRRRNVCFIKCCKVAMLSKFNDIRKLKAETWPCDLGENGIFLWSKSGTRSRKHLKSF